MGEYGIKKGLCYRCGHPKLSKLAEKYVEPGVMENGNWIGDFTKEKSEKWKNALEKAEIELTKVLIEFWADCETISFCVCCLQEIIKEVETSVGYSYLNSIILKEKNEKS